MRNFFKYSISAIITVLLVFGCDGSYDSLVNSQLRENPEPEPVEANSGSADFSRYVAIGNSLTAGFMDSALYDLGQGNSLGALLAAQFALAGGAEEWNQPNINSTLGFNTSGTNPVNGTVLGRFKLDTSLPGPSPTIGGDMIEPYTGDKSALRNFGVPGLNLRGLVSADLGNPGSSQFNPFYARFASNPGVSTVLDDAIATDPTFFTLWIGSNDVLGYALRGGTGAGITPVDQFQADYEMVVDRLMTETSAQGVIANIPDVLQIPFFRLVAYNVIELNQEQVDQLTEALAGFNQVLDGLAEQGLEPQEDMDRRKVSFQVGANPIMIKDPDLKDLSGRFNLLVNFGAITPEQRDALLPYAQARQMTSAELALLSASQVLGTPSDPSDPQSPPIGVAFPLEPQFHLTENNIAAVHARSEAFNGIIESSVQANGRIALVDINASGGTWEQLFGLDGSSDGINISGRTLLPDFTPNGVFSTDGVHPNSRGNAILANEFLAAIEAAFEATLPRVDVLNLPSTQLCAGDCLSQQESLRGIPNLDFSTLPHNL